MVAKDTSFVQRRIAMLIDGDNAQPSLISQMLAETFQYGQVTIRRIYGDWTTPNMSGWKDVLQLHAIQPYQQFRYTIGKNATDSAMIIDAMDILHSETVNGFCLVSSDSDYTRLATRIREDGLFVMGIGKSTTPSAFVKACDLFVLTENLKSKPDAGELDLPRKTAGPSSVKSAVPLLRAAFDNAVQEDGWAFLGGLGHHLRQLYPSFDPRSYGYKQLSQLVNDVQLFEVKEVDTNDPNSSAIYVRLKEKKGAK